MTTGNDLVSCCNSRPKCSDLFHGRLNGALLECGAAWGTPCLQPGAKLCWTSCGPTWLRQFVPKLYSAHKYIVRGKPALQPYCTFVHHTFPAATAKCCVFLHVVVTVCEIVARRVLWSDGHPDGSLRGPSCFTLPLRPNEFQTLSRLRSRRGLHRVIAHDFRNRTPCVDPIG